MPSARDALLTQARAIVPVIDPERLAARLEAPHPPVLVDVREVDETESGRIPGATVLARGFLELRMEGLADLETPVVLYCASGTRSLLAGKTLLDMGYSSVVSLEGGVEAWKASGRTLETPPSLTSDERRRYARHLRLPEVGEAGQLRLRSARVLIIGAGGLGAPAALYLAGAGVGTLGLVDDDLVEVSNLQRQILHRTSDSGTPKVHSAVRALKDLNPSTCLKVFMQRFEESTAQDILRKGWDAVIDGTDLISARYVINEACVRARVPVIHGAIHRFEGQVSVFAPDRGGPCYHCLFPMAPPAHVVPSCAEAGVLGPLPGVVGSLQALEAMKLVLGCGQPLIGRLLRFDALRGTFEELRIPRDPQCRVCGSGGGLASA